MPDKLHTVTYRTILRVYDSARKI